MFEQKVTVTVQSIVATVLWVTGVSVAIAQMFVAYHIGSLGIVCACAGATLTVRQYLLLDHRRNVAAFELGRGEVRNLRS